MDWLFEPFAYELSTWHPLAVHLPVVLLPLGALGACVYAVTGRGAWRIGLLALYVAASLAAWWAVETGERLYEEVEGTPIVEALIEQHEEPAEWALRLSVATALLLGGVTGWRAWHVRGRLGGSRGEEDPRWVRGGVLGLALAAAVLVAYAGHVGGVMVWGR